MQLSTVLNKPFEVWSKTCSLNVHNCL